LRLVVKRRIQTTLERVTIRLRRSSVSKRFLSPSTTGSVAGRGIEWIYFVVLFLLIAGAINAITNGASPGIQSEVIVPSPSAQSVTETFVMLFTYIVGALGAYALYLSGRQTVRARSAEMFFVIGFLCLAVAMVIGYLVLSIK
jgi:hypothetical protein